MHAHERTMLARLGFADPDRREQLHDLACQYLATPEAVRRLIKHLGVECGPFSHEESGDLEARSLVSWEVLSHHVNHEVEISKGHGQYRTTIGFADLVLTLDTAERYTNVQRRRRIWSAASGRMEWSDWQSVADYMFRRPVSYGIEVKITPTPTSDVIRQVNLYRSYSGIDDWFVATAYGLVSDDVALLENENIEHIRLGERFREYVAMRQATELETGVEI